MNRDWDKNNLKNFVVLSNTLFKKWYQTRVGEGYTTINTIAYYITEIKYKWGVRTENDTNIGYTVFKSTGVVQQYPLIDLVNQQVTCTVVYKEKTYMTVIVDVKNDSVSVQGNVDELGALAMSKEDYIEMFKDVAKLFIDNNVSDAYKYFDALN